MLQSSFGHRPLFDGRPFLQDRLCPPEVNIRRRHVVQTLVITPMIVMIDKSVDALTRIGDRHYIIERGGVVWQGDSAALRGSEDLQHRYLGV